MPPHPPELKEIRKMTRSEVEVRILQLWEKTEKEIAELVNHPETNMRDKTIMRVMLRAIAKGDYAALGFIMDLVFGKRPERINIDATSNGRTIEPVLSISKLAKDPEIFDALMKINEKLESPGSS